MGLFDENFLSDLKNQVQQSVQSTISDTTQSVSDFMSSNIQNTLVRVGVDPGGNLSQDDIANGKTGSGIALRASQQAASVIANAAQVVTTPKGMAISTGMIIAGLAALYFLMGRK